MAETFKQELLNKVAYYQAKAEFLQNLIDYLTNCGLDWDNLTNNQIYYIRKMIR